MARAIQQEKGVTRAKFAKQEVELHVTFQPKQTTLARLIQRVGEMGFVALKGPGQGKYLPPVKFEKSMDVRWIARKGEAVSLQQHLAPGKVTVFDFAARWCGPCKDVDRALFSLLQTHTNVAVRKINVVDWDRPVVRQHMSGVSQLPYLIIFDKQGRKAKVIVGRKLDLLRTTIQRLARSQS